MSDTEKQSQNTEEQENEQNIEPQEQNGEAQEPDIKTQEDDVNLEEIAINKKIGKLQKKSSVGRIILICLLVILILAVIAIGAVAIYINSRLDLINYETSGGAGGVSLGGTIAGESEVSFADPEYMESQGIISTESSNILTQAPPTPSQEPSYEEIENQFDGINISEDYEEEVINILLIGADNAASLSDVMMLASINPVKERIVLTSFLRDSYVEIPGYGYNKLNAAHSLGGSKLLVQTIEHNFGLDIDNYVRVNFNSFKAAVDAIGGVELVVNADNYNYFRNWSSVYYLSKSEAIDGTHTVHLDGDDALAYARNRNYADGDFTRTLHQRDFISQFVTNCKSASLTDLDKLLVAVLPYIATDISKGELTTYLLSSLSYLKYDLNPDVHMPCDDSWEFGWVYGSSVLNINLEANEKHVKAAIYG